MKQRSIDAIPTVFLAVLLLLHSSQNAYPANLDISTAANAPIQKALGL